MDPATLEILSKLAQQGPAGLLGALAIGAAIAARYFYNKREDERTAADARYAALQAQSSQALLQAKADQATAIQTLTDRITSMQEQFRIDVARMQEDHQRELTALQDARLADGKAYRTEAQALHDRIHTSIDKVAEVMDRIVPTANPAPQPKRQPRLAMDTSTPSARCTTDPPEDLGDALSLLREGGQYADDRLTKRLERMDRFLAGEGPWVEEPPTGVRDPLEPPALAVGPAPAPAPAPTAPPPGTLGAAPSRFVDRPVAPPVAPSAPPAGTLGAPERPRPGSGRRHGSTPDMARPGSSPSLSDPNRNAPKRP